MAAGREIEPGPYWWKVSALTTMPILLSHGGNLTLFTLFDNNIIFTNKNFLLTLMHQFRYF